LDDAAIQVTDEKFKKTFPSYDGSEAEQAKVLEKYTKRENVRFEEFEGVMCLRYKQNPVQQMAAVIDFPQIMVDKSKYFGNSNPLPLRTLLNREFTLPGDKTKIVAAPYIIREIKHDLPGGKTTWAFAKNNGLHKLADAVGLLDKNGLFTKNRIGELVGKVAQFQVQVYMKPGKSGSSYFTESVKLVGMVPEGIPIPEVPAGTLHLVNLFAKNDPEAVKNLRVSIKNHIKRANNYDASILKGEIEAHEAGRGEQSEPQETAKAPVTGIVPKALDPDEDFDDDVPF